MISPVTPATGQTRAQRLYREDGWTWAMEQAETLRRRDTDSIDWEHVIEEIEDAGKRHRDRWVSNRARAMEHMLAIEHYGWASTGLLERWVIEVRTFRGSMAREIRRIPGLSGNYEQMFAWAWEDVRYEAVGQLAHYDSDRTTDEHPAKTPKRDWSHRLPRDSPYAFEDVAAFDHRTQREPRDDVRPASVAHVLNDRLGRDYAIRARPLPLRVPRQSS